MDSSPQLAHQPALVGKPEQEIAPVFKEPKGMAWIVRTARLWRMLRENRISICSLAVWIVRSIAPRRTAGTVDPPTNILVIRLDAMGDLIMTAPIFRELKLRYPHAKITAVVQKRNRGILDTNPHVDRILHPPEPRKSRLLQEFHRELSVIRLYWGTLRSERFDLALQPRLGPDYYAANLLLKLVDAPVSVKYCDSTTGLAGRISNLMCSSMVGLPRPKAQHEMASNGAIAEFVTGNVPSSRPEIFLSREDREGLLQRVGHIKRGTTILCLAFGAQAERRKWPLAYWAELIRLLSQERDLFVFVICSTGERNEGIALQSMLFAESSLLSGAGLREAAACLELCQFYIGPDSGLAHMAAAVGCTPIVVSPHPIHGDPEDAGSPVRMAPYSSHARIVQPREAIPPCRDRCEAIDPHCILQITPVQIAEVCMNAFRSMEREDLEAQKVGTNPR
jgi:heptosyltransferase-2